MEHRTNWSSYNANQQRWVLLPDGISSKDFCRRITKMVNSYRENEELKFLKSNKSCGLIALDNNMLWGTPVLSVDMGARMIDRKIEPFLKVT